jgi:hypothetical protein
MGVSSTRLTALPDWLNGHWRVRRTINDGGDRFTGNARFVALQDGRTRWEEDGELCLGEYRGPARRTLLIEPAGAPGTWLVRFDDERPFHELDLRGARWEAEHLCGPDVYRGVFEVLSDSRLAVTWRVTGPGREDRIASDYRRVSSG